MGAHIMMRGDLVGAVAPEDFPVHQRRHRESHSRASGKTAQEPECIGAVPEAKVAGQAIPCKKDYSRGAGGKDRPWRHSASFPAAQQRQDQEQAEEGNEKAGIP